MTDASPPTDDLETPAPDAPRRRTKLRRRIKQRIGKWLMWVVRKVMPPLYCAYMWFVYKTSRVEYVNTDLLWMCRERYGGLVGVMWHQEVFMVAWAFRQYEGHTLANQGDFGDLIAAMLKLNGFVVFRGGSQARSRKRKVLPELIRHMQEVPGVAYGITCDGSRGPAYRIKQGSVVVAHVCHKPMIASRTWCKRRIDLKGWDRAYIPLPFNRIVQAFAGPYFVPTDADDPERLEAFRQELEGELLELTHWVHRLLDDPPRDPGFGFPEGWTPSWGDDLPRYPFEAPEGHPARNEAGAQPQHRGAQRRQAAAVARWTRAQGG